MRRLLRRLAWLIARLLIVLVLSFFVLARATRTQHEGGADFSTDRLEEMPLPLFFNAHPADLECRVNAIVERLSRGPSQQEERELLRLGGASLPLLLPQMSGLPVEVRSKLAWDLLPLAQRMTWRGASEVTSPARAYDYFLEMWKERSVDYQPTIVARWVERLSARGGSALKVSVIEYDTYALPALMAALPDVSTPADVERARQLLSVVHRVTGLHWTLSPTSGVDEARTVVDHWRRWWRLHAIEYTSVRGPSRWSAMLTQTQFGQWATLALHHRFGRTRDHRPISRELASAAVHSLVLLFAGTVGAIGVALFKRRRSQPDQSTAQPSLAMLALTSLPQTSIVAFLALAGVAHNLTTAAVVATIAIAHLDLDGIGRLETDLPLATLPGTPDGAKTRRRRPLPSWLFAGHAWPILLSLIFVIERAFNWDGLGRCCVDAFRQRDLNMLMAITTITALWLLLIELAVQLNLPSWHRRPPLEQAE